MVGWVSGATRAFVLAGRFVGIYPTPVSIFAGAGYLWVGYVQLRKSMYIGKNRSQFSYPVAKIFNIGLFNVHKSNYMVLYNKKHTNFNIHLSLLILIGSHISKIGVI